MRPTGAKPPIVPVVNASLAVYTSVSDRRRSVHPTPISRAMPKSLLVALVVYPILAAVAGVLIWNSEYIDAPTLPNHSSNCAPKKLVAKTEAT